MIYLRNLIISFIFFSLSVYITSIYTNQNLLKLTIHQNVPHAKVNINFNTKNTYKEMFTVDSANNLIVNPNSDNEIRFFIFDHHLEPYITSKSTNPVRLWYEGCNDCFTVK